MDCNKCHRDNPDDAQFCGGCGTSLNVSTITNTGVSSAELPMVDFGTGVKLGFQRYVDCKGRSTRAEYWWWALFTSAVALILIPIDIISGTHSLLWGMGLLGGLFSLATIIPSLAVGVRRLHDINRTGWWMLLWLVPEIGWVVLIVWAIERGNKGLSKYGSDPRQPTSTEPYKP